MLDGFHAMDLHVREAPLERNLVAIILLVFLSVVELVPTGTDRSIDYLAPATLGLAVMSSSMVRLVMTSD